MKRYHVIALGLALAFGGAHAADRCGGGESGPKPLSDITSGFKVDTQTVPTMSSPQEFIFWERSNKVVYRTDMDEVFTGLVPSGAFNKLTSMSRTLARLKDDNERYLVAESSPAIFDRKYNRWFNYALDARPFRHLFLHDDELYSISAKIDQKNRQYINVYKYEVGDAYAKKVCKTIVAEPGEHFTLAEGSAYPQVFFYRVKQGEIGKLISLYSMDVSFLCNIAGLGQYTREIAGPVKSVHMFPRLEALAVEVDHPTRNLLWDSRTGCRYFNIGRQKPLVLNHRFPVIATWNEQEGMNLVHLDKEQTANVAWGYGNVTELTQRDVWLADDGKRLFVTPAFGYAATRWLFRMTLGEQFQP